MANKNFGWLIGVDFCQELSGNGKSLYACLMVMPTARAEDLSALDLPALKYSAQEAATAFGDLLTPWAIGRVEWTLWKIGTDGTGTQLPATRVPLVTAPDLTQADTLRADAKDEVRRMVTGHPDVFQVGVHQPSEMSQPVPSYAVACAGLAHIPAMLSDDVLGLSAILEVDDAAAGLGLGDRVVAAPVLGGDKAVPVSVAEGTNQSFVIQYRLKGLPAPQAFDFRCECRTATRSATADPDPVVAVSIDSGEPRRAQYARVGSLLFPALLWARGMQLSWATGVGDATTPASLRPQLAILLGCGEDELYWQTRPDGKREIGNSESVLQLLVREERLVRWFGQAKKWQEPMRRKFAQLAGDASFTRELFTRFAEALKAAGAGNLAAAAEGLAAFDPAGGFTAGLIDQVAEIASAFAEPSARGRGTWACWLSVVVPTLVAQDGKEEAREFAGTLRAGATHAFTRPQEPDPAAVLQAEDCLRLISGKLDLCDQFWELLHSVASVIAALEGGLIGDMVATVAKCYDGTAAKEAANGLVALLEKDLSEAVADPAGSRAADDGSLNLRFMTGDPSDDIAIRGHIIALRVGVPVAGSTDPDWIGEPCWITNHQARLVAAGKPGATLQAGNKDAELTDTVGATMADGLALVDTPYDGQALQALDEAHATTTQSHAIEPSLYFPVRDRRTMPQLGYGLRYQALAGTVNNAGAIVQPALRDGTLLARPEIRDVSEFTGAIHPYLSRQVPGLATFGEFDDLGLSSETFTHNHLQLANERSNILVLFEGTHFSKSRSRVLLGVRAPTCSSRFAQRWLAADALAPTGSDFRWHKLRSWDRDSIEKLSQDVLREVPRNNQTKRAEVAVTHPAIDMLKMRVTWFDRKGNSQDDRTDGSKAVEWIDLLHLDGTKWLKPEGFQIRVELGTVRDLKRDGDVLVVTVPPRMTARVDIHSVIRHDYAIKPATARFQPDVLKDFRDEATQADGTAGLLRLVSKASSVLWSEGLSDTAPSIPPAYDGMLKLRRPVALNDPAEIGVEMNTASTVDAEWISGFSVVPKRWRWSGYPVDFPAGQSSGLGDWVPLYAGVSNELPGHPDGTFSTRLDTTKGWLLKATLMEPVRLPGVRIARHVGIETVPRLRHASILGDEVLRGIGSRNPLPLYELLHGISAWTEDSRLQPPVWQESVPLPQAFAADRGGSPVPAGRGALLLLEDPLYDTGDLAEKGGVAERLDLDLVATWVDQVREAGANPIMHPPTALPGLNFSVEPPFGLTYDQSHGGYPAQTGVVVLTEHSSGKWLLAKFRIRRYVEPDFMRGAELAPASDGRFTLPLRRSDVNWIPTDFVVDGTVSGIAIALGSYRYELVLPAGAAAGTRLLVSWHKEQWAAAEGTWRPQVVRQERKAGTGTWVSTSTKATGFDQKFDFKTLAPLDQPGLVLTLPAGVVAKSAPRRVLMSDYTQGRWLTFIGSFGVALGDSASYKLKRVGGGFSLTSSLPALPTFSAADSLTPTLLLVFRPVPDAMQGALEADGGALVGVYASNSVATHTFDHGILPLPANEPIANCKAVIIQAQRPHLGTADDLIPLRDWEEVQRMLLPDEHPTEVPAGGGLASAKKAATREATLRLLPEYLGPLIIE